MRFWTSDEAARFAYQRQVDRLSFTLRPTRREDYWFADLEEDPYSATRPVAFERALDDDEATLVRAGLGASDMKQKWFAYADGDRLHLHRSWTGYEVFSLRLRTVRGRPGVLLDQLQVCDDRERYSPEDDRHALGDLEGVLGLMLGGQR